MITILVEVSFCHKLQSLLLPWTSTMTPARGYRNIAEPSKAWRTLLHPPPAHVPFTNFPQRPEVCPLGCGGARVALPLPFSQVLAPSVPSTVSSSLHSSALPAPQIQLLRQTWASHLFPGGPIPLHTLPLGSCCPWGLPCHLSELSLFCTHRRLRLIDGKSFGLFCTRWVNS